MRTESESESEYAEYLKARMSRLHRTAFLLCGDAHRAEDIVQSTAVTLYLKWDKIKYVENVDGYVHRMLVRQFLDQCRRPWARVLLAGLSIDRAASEPARDENFDDRDAVTRALGKLPPGQRAVLVLRYFSDLSVEDTAAALRCSTGNVKSQAARGLASLRRLLSGVAEPTFVSDKGSQK